jgi:hypothetical protein
MNANSRQAIARTGPVLVLALLAFSTAATVGLASASPPPQPSDYTLAEVPFHTAGGDAVVGTELRILFCIDNDSQHCSTHPLESLTFPAVTLASAGSTIWADSSGPGLNNVIAELTDGGLDLLGFLARVNVSGPGWTIQGEPDFFGAQVGPSGIDLSGYAIHRIGFRVDAVSIDSPGEDPNGDGVWTDFSLSGAFVFEGTISSSAACKDDGWQSLRGPDGTTFENQGRCVQFATTGK